MPSAPHLSPNVVSTAMPPLASTRETNRARREGKQEAKEGPTPASTRPGIVYMSRVPPKLTPAKLRRLLEAHGEVSRVYLAPSPTAQARGTRQYVEGWIEFAEGKVAKRVATLLNGAAMGGRRRSAHFEDLWTLQYLPRLTWNQLTEDVAARKATRRQRLQMEVAAARAEGEFYAQHAQKKMKNKKQEAKKEPEQEEPA